MLASFIDTWCFLLFPKRLLVHYLQIDMSGLASCYIGIYRLDVALLTSLSLSLEYIYSSVANIEVWPPLLARVIIPSTLSELCHGETNIVFKKSHKRVLWRNSSELISSTSINKEIYPSIYLSCEHS